MAAFGIALLDAMRGMRTANDALKYLRSVDSKLDQAGLKLKISELADIISETREKLIEAKEENDALQARIKELESTQDLRSRIIHRGNVYYVREESGEAGPICVKCYEADQKRMPLTKLPPELSSLAQWRCPQCRNTY